MMIEIIALYFIIAFILSVVSAYYEYCHFYLHEDIETYFDVDFLAYNVDCFIHHGIYT